MFVSDLALTDFRSYPEVVVSMPAGITAFVLVPLQTMASEFLLSMKDYPPSQTPGDWSLDALERQIRNLTAGAAK